MSEQNRARMNDEDPWSDSSCSTLDIITAMGGSPDDVEISSSFCIVPPLRRSPSIDEAHPTLGVKERLNQPTAMSEQKRARMNDEDPWSDSSCNTLEINAAMGGSPDDVEISSSVCIVPPLRRSPSIDEAHATLGVKERLNQPIAMSVQKRARTNDEDPWSDSSCNTLEIKAAMGGSPDDVEISSSFCIVPPLRRSPSIDEAHPTLGVKERLNQPTAMSEQKRARMNDEDPWSDSSCNTLEINAAMGGSPDDVEISSSVCIVPPLRRSPSIDEAHATLGVKERLNQPTAMSVQKRARTNDEDPWSDSSCNTLEINAAMGGSPDDVEISSSFCFFLPLRRSPSIEETAMSDEDKLTCLQLFPHGDSHPEPQNLSYVSQQDLAPEDLTDMLCLCLGNEGRIDNIRSNNDQVTELNDKIVVSSRKIGKGSNGTIVYEGKYDGRLAAVKRLVRDCLDDDVSREIDILIKSDRHENIVRYYGVERGQDFVYLALELCTCSLDDLIQVHSDSSNNSAFPGDRASMDDDKIKLASVRSMMQKYRLWQAYGYPSRWLLKLMRDMVLGLSHLHELRIIHRDLKPQNVLIAENQELVARLSDMGISLCLPEDKSSLEYPTTGCGTSGWRAPEVLCSGGRQTRAMDLFSLGCVLFFCITRGKHPFGDKIVRDSNILDDKKDLSRVEFIPEAHDLILRLLNREPKLRPKASEVLHHPFFWSSKTRLSFLSDVSNKVEFETKAGNLDLLNALESTAKSVFVGNWEDKIEPAVRAKLWRRRRYDGSLVRHLLRAVRNVYSHHMEFPEEVKEILGPVASDLDAYFAIRFPRLLIESYRVVSQICRRKELLEGVLSK